MLARFRPRLTYANLAASLALFIALGGSALAAHHYLLTSTKQISPKVLKKLRLSTTLPRGQTLRGEFQLDDSDRSANSFIGTAISFGGFRLKTAPAVSAVDIGGAPTASCPGTSSSPAAARGKLCLYITSRLNVRTTGFYTLGPGITAEDATTATDGKTDTFGAQLYAQLVNPGRGYVAGTWAVTAP